MPSDQTVVVERFRDEIGDWRLVVLTPRAAGPRRLGPRDARKLRDQHGLEADAIHSDDGIAVHLPDADEPPGGRLVLIDPDDVRGSCRGELSVSSRPVRGALP